MNKLRQLFLLIVLTTVSTAVYSESYTGGQPVNPQPESSALSPGLSIKYFFDYFNHIDELSRRTGGMEGDPLMNLDHNTINGNVLTADRPMGVGCHIRGFIKLEQTGNYIFRVESNDGVRIHIAGIKIWTDPEIHGNRWSRPLEYEVMTPGWYEFHMDYYQRKGTSAIKFAWTLPGGSEEEIVPASAFAY